MQPTRHVAKRTRISSTYVCLSCRLHSSKASIESNSSGLASIEQDASSSPHSENPVDNHVRIQKRRELWLQKLKDKEANLEKTRRASNGESTRLIAASPVRRLVANTTGRLYADEEDTKRVKVVDAKQASRGSFERLSQAAQAQKRRGETAVIRKIIATDIEGRELHGLRNAASGGKAIQTKGVRQTRLTEIQRRLAKEDADGVEREPVMTSMVDEFSVDSAGGDGPRVRRHSTSQGEDYLNDRNSSPVYRGYLKGDAIRKQWGTPFTEKQQELAQKEAQEEIDALLEAQRKTSEGEEVDLQAIEESAESRRRRNRVGVFRPAEEESFQAALPSYVQHRDRRDLYRLEKRLRLDAFAAEELDSDTNKQNARQQDVVSDAKRGLFLMRENPDSDEKDLRSSEFLTGRIQDFDDLQYEDGNNSTSAATLHGSREASAVQSKDTQQHEKGNIVSASELAVREQQNAETNTNPTNLETFGADRGSLQQLEINSESPKKESIDEYRPFAINRMAWHKRPLAAMPLPAPSGNVRARLFHTNRYVRQQAAAAVQETEMLPPPEYELSTSKVGIRDQLRKWQELHGNNEEDSKNQVDFDVDTSASDISNTLTRLPGPGAALRRQDREEEEREALNHFMQSTTHDGDNAFGDNKFLKPGDLVELEFPMSERESLIAVFVRRLGIESQFFTSHGRWVMMPERQVQYSIPGWISPNLVKPIIAHLPTPKNRQEADEMQQQAYVEDMSVPRHVAAPLVTRMVEFHAESQEIYRKHASTLDRAHEILAHDTDLRYGSLVSAATTLLRMPKEKLPVTALFTVRSALSRAGFAFNIDRRSHRLTGYLQIRSKEQVKMVGIVRNWIREWQDDRAIRAALANDRTALRKHRSSKGAQYVQSFIERAQGIILKSRETRSPSSSGNIGPSKTRLPITPTSDCVRPTTDDQFTEQDTELVRFMEAWACSGMFVGLPRLCALPPLILQAIGLYENEELATTTGFLFLQELGTIMPYENRIRFDQHLLLPSSQHSKPLQNLMTSLLEMKDKHNFSDSMRDLRHDWKDLPVYCIDDASAHEIDDGISIERAGKDEWWVHVHIANPTAFFERDHPLAKMARHMGESIYMPERTYMMLPRWSTLRHFSLAKDRPCLTFSTKMDGEGRTLDKRARSGFVRHVLRLTKDETNELLEANATTTEEDERIVLTVGGEPPPSRSRKSILDGITGRQKEDLKVLHRLAIKRGEQRQAAGGVFFDAHKPDVEVWQNWKSTGLAWDHPHRIGSRTVEGDPVIQMRTKGFRNWFAPVTAPAEYLVREMMLLACETATSWCADRQIPVLYRGSVHDPTTPDPEWFKRKFIEPAAKHSPDGSYPMHIGLDYIKTVGSTVLSTTPIRHNMLGMEHYGKVTSPLRRYGDMIIHWQVEAALREEARRNKSLKTDDRNADRSFLPFSNGVLNTIMLGLQPREKLILMAKNYTLNFWQSMLLFRAIHYGESDVPFQTPSSTVDSETGKAKPLMKQFCTTENVMGDVNSGINMDLNINCNMMSPEKLGLGGIRKGDVWEGEFESVSVYHRSMTMRPTRLVSREEGTGLVM